MTTHYADVEHIIIAALLAQAPDVTASVQSANDLLDDMPFIRIARIGGYNDRLNDVARVDVEAFAATRAEAKALADTARFIVLDLRCRVYASWLVDDVTTESAPAWVDYADEHISRFVATYSITTRISA